MGVEIERKFLVTGDGWRDGGPAATLRQGYLNLDPDRTVRVRIAGNRAFLTVKGRARGALRSEYEYPVPVEDAEALLGMCEGGVILKTRTRIPGPDVVWEVDEFAGDNAGLVVAECELESEDQPFALPSWLGDEVTDDPRYGNSSLARRPFGTW